LHHENASTKMSPLSSLIYQDRAVNDERCIPLMIFFDRFASEIRLIVNEKNPIPA